MSQKKQSDWLWEWQQFTNDSLEMFQEWIYPNRLEDFLGKTALDAGCGGGHHLTFVAPYAKKVVGVDLNSANVARAHLPPSFQNIQVLEGDIATVRLGESFDVVYSLGVVPHAADPDATMQNLKKHLAPGGRLIFWGYSREGNFILRWIAEPLKKAVFLKLPKPILRYFSLLLTTVLYVPIYTIYLLPLSFLPYYDYFRMWRRWNFARNFMNVFDKLNAPTTTLISRAVVEKWFNKGEFKDIHISHYLGVSWRASGTKL